MGVPCPVLCAVIAQEVQGSVEQAIVWRKEEEPNGGCAHHGQYHGVEESEAQDANAACFAVDKQGKDKPKHNADGHGSYDVEKRVFNNLNEVGVGEEFDIVAKTDENGFAKAGDVQTLPKETLINRNQHWVSGE